MADEKKSENTPENIIEGAKPGDTVAETAKPDADAKSLKEADDKKVGELPTETKADSSQSSDKNAEKPAAEKPGADKATSADKQPATKKEKPPKLEDKPFNEFMEQHYLPSLKEALAKEGIGDLSVEFAKRKIEVMGQSNAEPYWQVQGQWEEAREGQRQFNIAFIDEDISGQKVFTLTTNGAKPSTIEQFMGDERRITLDLLVMYTLQRLNGEKWLTRN